MTDSAPLAPVAPTEPAIEIRASLGSFAAVNAVAALGGAAFLAAMIALRPGIIGSAFPVMYGVFLLYLALDTAYWLWRGVHRAALDGEALHLWRGRALRHERIPLGEFTDAHLHRRMGRRSLQLLRGGRVVRVPGATFYPGRKVWITSDAFDNAAFDRFAVAASAAAMLNAKRGG